MLAFHPLRQHPAPPGRIAELLQDFRSVLEDQGMASMEEYGDLLKWPLPSREGTWRNFHVFHPDWCSYSDRFWGTIHFHAGAIRGTVLAGHLWHDTYEATPDPNGDRFYGGQAYTLTRHTHPQGAGTSYELPGHVPHWLRPTELTITYFEEDVADGVSDLVNPASEETDEHTWTQAMADGLLPELLGLVDERLAALALVP